MLFCTWCNFLNKISCIILIEISQTNYLLRWGDERSKKVNRALSKILASVHWHGLIGPCADTEPLFSNLLQDKNLGLKCRIIHLEQYHIYLKTLKTSTAVQCSAKQETAMWLFARGKHNLNSPPLKLFASHVHSMIAPLHI